ncbi:MAG: alpha/beta hydrolase [Chitinophagales bacterium]
MVSCSIPYKRSLIHYQKSGIGPRPLFCFHGYGESGDSFALLAPYLHETYTLIAIDLPFHGQTLWEEGLNCLPAEMLEIIDRIGNQEDLLPSRITIAGYSMGGRVALSLLEIIPEKIERLILLAPDGLKMNGWYWLATHTFLGNRLFRFTMAYPAWFLGSLRLLGRIKGVNQSIHKFAISYLEDRQMRNDLYDCWITMRAFKPSSKEIKRLIVKYKILVDLIYGRFDRMIRYEGGKVFSKGIESQCRLSILQAGHQLIHPKNLEPIISIFLSSPH